MSATRKTLVKPRAGGTLKRAQATLVEAAGGTVAAADVLEKGQSTVQRYTDPAEPSTHMTVADARKLNAATGCLALLEFMAGEAGCALLPIEGLADLAIGQDFASYGARSAQLFADYSASLGDGRIDCQEAGRMIDDVDAVMAALALIRRNLEAKREEET